MVLKILQKNANHLCTLQRKQLRRIHFIFVENFRIKKVDAYPNEETGGNAHEAGATFDNSFFDNSF
jgi:hypothetical protein